MASRYQLSRRLFFLLLGLAEAIAFASLWVQVEALLGSQGIRPAAVMVARARDYFGSTAWHALPTLLWWWPGDAALQALCALGVACGLLAALGIAPRWALAVAWLAYLSLVSVGDVFLGYQWDALLLETTLLAIVYAPGGLWPRWRSGPPPSHVGLWLLRWLLFRLVFLSGWVKLASGNPAWHDLTALTYHYWTQPLPNPLAWWANLLPLWFQKLSAAAMFAVELVAPFLIFAPRPFRLTGAAAIAGLMAGITLTGNYGFFTLLAVTLCLTLVDDQALTGWLPRRWRAGPEEQVAAVVPRWRQAAAVVVGVALFVPTLAPTLQRMGLLRVPPQPLGALDAALDPFRTFNSYGLFAVMTTDRLEIEVEGSDDGVTWRRYLFRWKPGPVERAPGVAGPHMPRLDWQMWFAALGSWRQAPWYADFVRRLLEGSPPVVGLLAHDPFPGASPRYVRSTLYRYRFTDRAARRATGAWWTRERVGPFLPTVELRDGQLRAVSFPAATE